MKIDFLLNGSHRFLDLVPQTTLLDLIRREFDLKSVHAGCLQGHCGSCTVLMDGNLTASCLVPVFHLKGQVVETIEHFLESPEFRDIEFGFLKTGFFPCKFCAGIKVLTAEAILRAKEHPKEEDIRPFITRSWCTCSAPAPFYQAVMAAAEYRRRRGHATRR